MIRLAGYRFENRRPLYCRRERQIGELDMKLSVARSQQLYRFTPPPCDSPGVAGATIGLGTGFCTGAKLGAAISDALYAPTTSPLITTPRAAAAGLMVGLVVASLASYGGWAAGQSLYDSLMD